MLIIPRAPQKFLRPGSLARRSCRPCAPYSSLSLSPSLPAQGQTNPTLRVCASYKRGGVRQLAVCPGSGCCAQSHGRGRKKEETAPMLFLFTCPARAPSKDVVNKLRLISEKRECEAASDPRFNYCDVNDTVRIIQFTFAYRVFTVLSEKCGKAKKGNSNQLFFSGKIPSTPVE